MWEKLLEAVIQNITPLGLVAVMVILNYRQNERSNSTMVKIYQQSRSEIAELSGDIKRLTSLIEKDKTEESRFDKVLSMYESAIVKITATQQKLADALDVVIKKLDRSDAKIDDLTLTIYKNTFKREMGKNGKEQTKEVI